MFSGSQRKAALGTNGLKKQRLQPKKVNIYLGIAFFNLKQ